MIEEIKKICGNSSDLITRILKIDNIKIDILYCETLSSSTTISNFILKPLEFLNKKNISFDDVINNISSPSYTTVENISDTPIYVFNGFTILVIDNKKIIAIETKEILDRGISEVESEVATVGPKDAFLENYNKNIGLIRKRIKSKNLYVDSIILGCESNTKVAICYMNNLVKKELVDKVLSKLKNIKNDIIMDSGFIKEEIVKTNLFPEMTQTERPDLACFALLEGKICLIIENSKDVLIIPSFFIDFFHTPDDYYEKNINTSFIRILRFISFFIAIFLPGYYISITTFNPTSIPSVLLLNLINQHKAVPFPAFLEIFIMIIAFEILRESDVRIPSKVGSSVSILGGLILGDAAVSAGVISPIMIIVVAISSISSLVFSYNSIINLIRYYRYFVLFLSIFFGMYGLFIGLAILIINLSSITTFDFPYTYPFVPLVKEELKDTFIKFKRNKKRNPLLSRKEDRT